MPRPSGIDQGHPRWRVAANVRTVEAVDLAPPPADAAPAPAPPPADEPAPPERILGGVAALLAERLEIDALWLRIAFVLLALVGGVGLVLYGALWLAFIVGADPDRRWARLAGGVVLVAGLPLLLTQGFTFFDGPWAVLALLIGLAVALWQPRPALRSVSSLLPPAPGRASEPGAPADERGGRRAARRDVRRTRRAQRTPSILGRLTFGVAIVVAAMGALIDQANGGRLHPEQWLGLAAVVCGCGLVVGAFVGRALWLVVPAALFAGTGFVAGEAARIGIQPSALIGDEHVYVGEGTSGNRTEREHVVIGTVDVNIDAAPVEPLTVDARAAIGDVRVWIADDVTVEVQAEVRHGHVEVNGSARGDGTFTVGPEGTPEVVVVATVGRGMVRVERFAGPPIGPPPFFERNPQYLADGVVLAEGGQVVLGDGEAVIDRDGTVLTGSTVSRDRVTVILTSVGEFQLLPGGLLLTPYGELLDLQALRSDPSTGGATSMPTVPTTPPLPTAEPVPTIPGG